MVTIRVESDQFGLPERPPVGFWVRIADSPAVLGVRDAMAAWFADLRPLDAGAPVVVRRYLTAATQPLGNLRRELSLYGFPDSSYLGETFERRVGARKLEYFRRRNTASLLVDFARDAQFRYVLSWLPASGGPRTRMNLCITPTALLADAVDWADFVHEWMTWSYPYFSNTGISVLLCPEARAMLDYSAATTRVYSGLVRYT